MFNKFLTSLVIISFVTFAFNANSKTLDEQIADIEQKAEAKLEKLEDSDTVRDNKLAESTKYSTAVKVMVFDLNGLTSKYKTKLIELERDYKIAKAKQQAAIKDKIKAEKLAAKQAKDEAKAKAKAEKAAAKKAAKEKKVAAK